MTVLELLPDLFGLASAAVVAIVVLAIFLAGLVYPPLLLSRRLRQGFGIDWLLRLTAFAALLFWLWRAGGVGAVAFIWMLIGWGFLVLRFLKFIGSADNLDRRQVE